MSSRIYCLLWGLLVVVGLSAQDSMVEVPSSEWTAPVATDSNNSRVFTEEDYLNWVQRYHPIIRQANLLRREGEAYQLKARGGFDPKIEGGIERKSFDGKNYFTIGETGLKIPSWFGAEFKAGYTWNSGIFLNPEDNLPNAGQAFAGVTWTLGQGLMIDERRAALQQARILLQANEAERQEIVNDLLLDAGKAYWEWVNAYNDWQIQAAALELATVRLDGVRNSFLQGDKPAIDTLESLIQVQNREIATNDVRMIYENSRRVLSNFLWYQNEIPVEVSDLLLPPYYPNISLPSAGLDIGELLSNLQEVHPILQQYRFKLQQLEVDRRLKKEYMKPQVDVEFNFLANGFDFVNPPKDGGEMGNFNALLTENYKAGITVGMPIFRRKARADLELVDLKLLDTNFFLRQKSQEIKNKILNYREQLDNSRQQVGINRIAVNNYERLLEAENEKFRFGESSIFLVNSREQKLVEAQLKLVKLLTVFHKDRLGLIWSAGQLPL
ncbi:MAG: TolC family protein, partial [Bacteroidota bacterium]